MSIGLQPIQKLQGLIDQHPQAFRKLSGRAYMQNFSRYIPMSESVNAFWLKEKNRESAACREHLAINMVMLATSHSPNGYLLPE